jgi:predicted Zn-dependent protease
MNKLIKTVILSLGIITLNTGQAQDVDLPDLGTQGGAIITPAEEYRTGATVVRNLRHAGLIVDDPLLTDYLNHLGYQLLSQHDYDAHNQFQFFLVNDNSLNAFALPGGFIGINYGLFSQTESESELASVVAHEIAHVTQRHYARAYDVGAQSSSLPVLAAIIAAIVLGSQSGQGGEIGEAALATAAAVSVREKINFTRQNEKEADRIGIQILSEAGFNPEDMASFFDKIERESRLHGINVPEFLRTHPVSASRISDARDRARQLPKNKSQATLDYQIMRHRILALSSSDKKSNLKTYQEALKTKTGEELVATQYGYVLSLTRLEKYQTAYQQIEVLLKEYPHKIAFLLAKAEIQFKDQNPSAAIRTYQHALQTYPGNESILHDYIDVLIKQKKYKPANKELEIFLKTQPQNPVFYKYLAETKAALNLTAESHEALAEYYYQRGQFHQAIDQINIALKAINNDFYTASKLEAKLRHIKEEIPPTTN